MLTEDFSDATTFASSSKEGFESESKCPPSSRQSYEYRRPPPAGVETFLLSWCVQINCEERSCVNVRRRRADVDESPWRRFLCQMDQSSAALRRVSRTDQAVRLPRSLSSHSSFLSCLSPGDVSSHSSVSAGGHDYWMLSSIFVHDCLGIRDVNVMMSLWTSALILSDTTSPEILTLVQCFQLCTKICLTFVLENVRAGLASAVIFLAETQEYVHRSMSVWWVWTLKLMMVSFSTQQNQISSFVFNTFLSSWFLHYPQCRCATEVCSAHFSPRQHICFVSNLNLQIIQSEPSRGSSGHTEGLTTL